MSEYEIIFRMLFGLTFVVTLVAIFYLLVRYYKIPGFELKFNKNLKLSEMLYIDNENKIIVMSNKNKNYIIHIGKNTSLLVDSYEN